MKSILKWVIGIVIFILWFLIPLSGLNIINKLIIKYDFSLFIFNERLIFTVAVVVWLSFIFTIYLRIPDWWVKRKKNGA